MAIITIEYQMGCGGRAIGQMLAQRLGFSYVDREIVQGVARQLQIGESAAEQQDERAAGLLGRALASLRASGELTWTAAPSMPPALIDDTVYQTTTCNIIEAAARGDRVVIVGHAAGFALADWPGALHVGLYASREQRVATVMQRLGVDRTEALRQVTESDHGRARYIKRFYNANWLDAEHYHLMVDTELWTPERVADLILSAWQASTVVAASPPVSQS